MNDTSKSLSIIAYFLSEYDMEAVEALGYTNRTQAFDEISKIFKRENNYLKLRRDEFDALPNSKSKRKGWRNRPAANDVVLMAEGLSKLSFNELLDLVKSLIKNQAHKFDFSKKSSSKIIKMPEYEFEYLINFEDESADIKKVTREMSQRVYDGSIIKDLKNLYGHKCQICGERPLDSEIVEAHHIEYFSKTHNNNTSNIVILCPNHHRLIHKYNPVYNHNLLQFEFKDGRIEKLQLNYHL